MIPLPAGCTVGYEIRIIVNDLTNDMGEWFELIGGHAFGVEEWDVKGRRKILKHVQYGHAKPSYAMKNGTGEILIRFDGKDASAASMFLIKFNEHVTQHNMDHYLHD